uniref:Uncharacterized protein n=1 Tax=Oryza rufipogon TaxID=4529 RepID=A0A0E0QFN6_ORYRU
MDTGRGGGSGDSGADDEHGVRRWRRRRARGEEVAPATGAGRGSAGAALATGAGRGRDGRWRRRRLKESRPARLLGGEFAPVEGDAMRDELVVMMGLARELTAMQRARAMT